jgi:hypothetical protein
VVGVTTKERLCPFPFEYLFAEYSNLIEDVAPSHTKYRLPVFHCTSPVLLMRHVAAESFIRRKLSTKWLILSRVGKAPARLARVSGASWRGNFRQNGEDFKTAKSERMHLTEPKGGATNG